MKPSERYERDAHLMLAFREAYVALLNNSKSIDDWRGSRLGPAVGLEAWQAAMHEVSAAAGAAVAAYARHGGAWTLRNTAYTSHDVSPVLNWEMSLTDPEQVSPQRVISSVDLAIGAARRSRHEASERERGLIGLVASFLRWPSDLREAVGPSASIGQRRAAGVVGVLGQILVGALATALASGLVAGAVALWGVL